MKDQCTSVAAGDHRIERSGELDERVAGQSVERTREHTTNHDSVLTPSPSEQRVEWWSATVVQPRGSTTDGTPFRRSKFRSLWQGTMILAVNKGGER